MTDLEIAKTLRDAAQYIRDHGWIQGDMGSPARGVCVLGGCWGAFNGFERLLTADENSRWEELLNALAPGSDWRRDLFDHPIAVWNDTPDRTAPEVVDYLESVALQYELRALAVTTLSQDAATAVCDNTVPEAVNA